jgi:hypothetical protein
MAKYEPLATFLRAQRTKEVSMTFADIERIVGAKLPPTAQRHRAWWSNNPSNSVMTKAWLDAGFRSEQVDLAARRLVFRRAGKPQAEPLPDTFPPESRPSGHSHHPLLGALKGLVRIMSGTDLTKSADPDWGRD